MKFKWYLLTVMVLMAVVLQSCGTDKVVPLPGKEVALRLEPGPDNFRNSEGDFITLKDGRILFVYTHFTGGNGDNDSAYLAGRYSDDKGRTWTQSDSLIVANEADMNIMSVSMLRLKTGEIALIYLRKNSETDCVPYMRISKDEAKSWGEPRRMIPDDGYFVMNNDRVVQLKDGRILMPVALHVDENYNSPIARIMSYYSDDNGVTFHKSSEAANPNKVVTQEPGIIELKSGRLLMFCRTDAGEQYFTWSNDRGETWSDLEPGNIKSPLSPASIERIPSTGDLLLLWNNNYKDALESGKRTPYNLALSSDEGKTWKKIKTIENDPYGWYCYTAIEFLEDCVLLGHCAGIRRNSNGLETTQITRLSLDWIYSEATADPVIKKDKDGTVELDCENGAIIRYTLDESLPALTRGVLYKEPFTVSGSTILLMQAFSDGKPPSRIVSAYVGVDVYQQALQLGAQPGPGIFYQYFEGSATKCDQIEKLPFVSSGTLDGFNIDKRRRDYDYAFIFNGYVDVPQDGQYVFYLESNDGSVLYIDEKLVINNDGGHWTREMSVSIALKKGKHKLECKYFQMAGGQTLKLTWKGPGIEKSEIPAELLFHGK